MKKLLFIIVVLFLSWGFTANLYAQEIVHCQCGIDAGGNCIPCDEPSTMDKISDSNDPGQPIPENVCACGSDGSGNCVPCNETYDGESRE